MRDCYINDADGWFRLRAAAIIINQGQVLMARNDGAPYYYSVGGAVGQNESTEEAVLREVYEETGFHYEIARLAFILENFFIIPVDGKPKKCHELAFYYLMKPRASMEIRCESHGLYGEKEEVVWLPLNALANKHLYPTFFKEYLPDIPAGVTHIIEREY